MARLSIIIPVYNERETILEILDRVKNVDLGQVEKEIIIVDDCSTDGTRTLLEPFKNQYKIIFHAQNYGKGRAIRTALKYITGNLVIIQDADLEYEPNDIKAILNKMLEPGVLVVYGSRRINKNYSRGKYSGFIYAIGGIFLTMLTNFLYGIKITDEPICYKMFKTDLLRELDLKCERFEFCPEVTAKIAKKKIKIHEVPVSYNPRHKNEGKKINWKDGIQAIWTLIKYRFIS